jgi:DNA (cytosine-5)-methyltransferase 1
VKLLDLFCCAGGAGMGYHRAGFEVVGVDIAPQPRYPFAFIQADAVEYVTEHGREYDAIHASPPCQHHSVATKSWNGDPAAWPDLIEPTREALRHSGKPYVIENVVGAPLRDPVLLCGTMFAGLRVLRHRLFECNWDLTAPEHPKHPLVYTRDKRKNHYGKLDESTAFVQVTGGGNCSKTAASSAMGIDWMTKRELNEAIPPAYTEYIGKQLLEVLS